MTSTETSSEQLAHIKSLLDSANFDDYVQAATMCQSLIVSEGRRPDLLYYGNVLVHDPTLEAKASLKLERFDCALDTVNSLLKLDPRESHVILKAQILEELGECEQALETLEAANCVSTESKQMSARIQQRVKQEAGVPASKRSRRMPLVGPEEQTLYASYVDWMKGEGAKLEKIGLKYFYPSYRGIVARRRIFKGETVIFVPKSAIITLRTAKQGEVGAQLVAKNVQLTYPNNSFLSTYVLSEQAKKESKWKVLFEAFPKSVSNFPAFFTEEEKKLLTGSPFLGMNRVAK